MSQPLPDPRTERRICCKGLHPNPSRESTTTPVERPFTASQTRNQRLIPQEPLKDITEALMEETLQDPTLQPETLSEPAPPPELSNLDLQNALLTIARQTDQRSSKKHRGVKEPDLFNGGSPDKLRAFIFQYQIYFCACEEDFQEDTDKIFFAISYLRGIALNYFEPYINEPDPLQDFDFLDSWSAFVQKLSNTFGSYSPEDDDEDAIVSIPFPHDGKTVSYFIQFTKYQNRIRWDDRSLYKVVKDAIPPRICDELRFSHEDTSSFEGFKRAIMRIDSDY